MEVPPPLPNPTSIPLPSPSHSWLLYQFSDSALPTGGFVASSGLGAAVPTGFVREGDVDCLTKFIHPSLHMYAYSTVPYVSKAWEMVAWAVVGKWGVEVAAPDIVRLDRLYEASTSNAVVR